jgi:hypothetical protein
VTYPECTCPAAWGEIFRGSVESPDCDLYSDCGGWTWDPPCGACDRCILDMALFYDEHGILARELTRYDCYREAQIMNA